MEEFDARRAAMELVTAFVNNHPLTATELPKLLTDVFSTVSAFGPNQNPAASAALATPEPAEAAEPAEAISPPAPPAEAAPSPAPVSAVSIEESISNPDYIISLINGEKFKTLKRHLRANGLTEAEYRERYNLPSDYPFVAPSYSQLRRGVAHKMGFGQRRGPDSDGTAGSEPSSAPTPPSETAEAPTAISRPSRSKAKPAKAKTTGSKAASTPQEDANLGAVPAKRTKASTKSKAPAASVKARTKGQTATSEAPATNRDGKAAERPKRTKLSPIFG